MKNLFLIVLIIFSTISCKKNETSAPSSTQTQNNTQTIIQDNRLLGGWRLDSMLWGSTISYSTGNGELTDSIRFSDYSTNGNSPVPDFHFFFISGNTITPLPDSYFWDTSSLDSLYFRTGNHGHSAASSYKFSINGNRLIITWSQWTINGYVFPPNPRVAINYYHK